MALTTAEKPKSFSELAAMTPPDRERVVDFLRAFSILCVVLGHWLISYIVQDGHSNISGSNALVSMKYGWLLTWFFQVMPIFFFVGGYANFVGIRSFRRKKLGYAPFVTSRVRRIMKPVITLLIVWVPINFVIDWRDVRTEKFAHLLSTLITQPLWFIGVYVIVISLAWPMYSLHEKWGAKFLIISAALPFIVDWLHFSSGILPIGYLNIFIWIWIHQLGYAYADGTLLAQAKSTANATTALWKKFGGLIMLTIGGLGLFFCSGLQKFPRVNIINDIAHALHLDHLPYPPSMVGLPGEKISNMNPPTVAIMFLAIAQIGIVIIVRDRLQKVLQGKRIWTFTVLINSMIMTIFCWHQSALCIVTLTRLGLNINEPAAGTGMWWATRPLLMGCYAIVLAGIVAVFWKYERWRNDDLAGIVSKSSVVCNVIILIIGLLGLALGGIDNMFGQGHDLLGLFQINAFLSVTLTICGAGAFGVLRNMSKVAQGDLVATE